MTTRKPSSWLIPSVADIIFLAIFLYLALYKGQDLLADGDTGFHIRAGEYIINTLSVPHHDLFSHIIPIMPWTAHEWLAEVIMALLHTMSGLTGVVVFHAFLIALVYYLQMRSLRSYGRNIFIAVAVVVLAAATSQIHWLARPHIYSLIFMVVWYRIIEDYQLNGKDRLIWLPLMMLPWVNLHGGYLTGMILLGIYTAGNLFTSLTAATGEKTLLLEKTRRLFNISLLTLLASLANPTGYKILLFPFNLVNNKFIMDHVHEFLSPNFHEPLYFKYLLLITIALLAYARKRLNMIELLLVLFFTHMALYSVRYVTLFAIVAAPIVLTRASDLLDDAHNRFAAAFKARADGFASTDGLSAGFLWPVTACLAVPLIISVHGIEFRFDEKQKPVAAVEFIQQEHISGNMYNNDEFGDYIIYKLWPQYRVFFDGRSDMYGSERLKEYFKVQNFEPDWEKIIEKYSMDWMIFDAKASLSRYLLAKGEWKLIYADKVAHIFVKDIPRHRALIEKHKGVKPVPVEECDKDTKLKD